MVGVRYFAYCYWFDIPVGDSSYNLKYKITMLITVVFIITKGTPV